MLTRRLAIAGGAATLAAVGVSRWGMPDVGAGEIAPEGGSFAVTHTEAEWRRRLSPEQFAVLRRSGTERPFTSPLNDEHRRGTFTCAGCAAPLYASDTKFDSHTGWPSFWQPLPGAVGQRSDRSFGTVRTAVHCGGCGGHLGHVFNDGPQPTGLRYCMNGVAMGFTPSNA